MLMPRLLHDAAKMSRLMGLSKPLPKRKVDRIKNIPNREIVEETLSVMLIAFTWNAVGSNIVTAEFCFQGWNSLMCRCQVFPHLVAAGERSHVAFILEYSGSASVRCGKGGRQH